MKVNVRERLREQGLSVQVRLGCRLPFLAVKLPRERGFMAAPTSQQSVLTHIKEALGRRLSASVDSLLPTAQNTPYAKGTLPGVACSNPPPCACLSHSRCSPLCPCLKYGFFTWFVLNKCSSTPYQSPPFFSGGSLLMH